MEDFKRDVPGEEVEEGKKGSRRETEYPVGLTIWNSVQTGFTFLMMSLGRIMDRNKEHQAKKQKSNN